MSALPQQEWSPLAAEPAAAPMTAGGRDYRRDHVVDLIKGLACLLMVLAHVPFPQARWLSIVTLASVMFFASTGMNLIGLVERRPGEEWRIAANGLFLIFAGFANNYVQGTLWMSDVFQSAGMAMLAMLALRRLLPRYWTWLFPAPFLIHWLNQHVFYWKTAGGGVSSFFLTPGLFPLLPWLSFYLLGAHLKRYNNPRLRAALWAGALAGVGLLALARPFHFDKFWMSTDYWLLGTAMFAALLDLARFWERLWSRRRRAGGARVPLAEMRYWGANSLVFYILHTMVLRALELVLPGGVAMFVLAVAMTAVLLRFGLALQLWARRQSAWGTLAGVGAFAGLILWLETLAAVHGNFLARTGTSFGLTFGFVAAYPAWKNLTARLTRPSAGDRKPPAASTPVSLPVPATMEAAP